MFVCLPGQCSCDGIQMFMEDTFNDGSRCKTKSTTKVFFRQTSFKDAITKPGWKVYTMVVRPLRRSLLRS